MQVSRARVAFTFVLNILSVVAVSWALSSSLIRLFYVCFLWSLKPGVNFFLDST